MISSCSESFFMLSVLTQYNSIWTPLFFGEFCFVWEALFDHESCYYLFFCSISLGFQLTSAWRILDPTVDFIFFIDICFNFFTAYTDDDGSTVLSHQAIVLHYLRSMFFFDLLALPPYYLIPSDSFFCVTQYSEVRTHHDQLLSCCVSDHCFPCVFVNFCLDFFVIFASCWLFGPLRLRFALSIRHSSDSSTCCCSSLSFHIGCMFLRFFCLDLLCSSSSFLNFFFFCVLASACCWHFLALIDDFASTTSIG